MGFRTFAIGRGKDKEALARKLRRHHYIDTGAGDPAKELQKFGGAKVILATAPDSKSISFRHRWTNPTQTARGRGQR